MGDKEKRIWNPYVHGAAPPKESYEQDMQRYHAYWRPVVDQLERERLAAEQENTPSYSMSAPPIVPGRGGAPAPAAPPASVQVTPPMQEPVRAVAHQQTMPAPLAPVEIRSPSLDELDAAYAREMRDVGPRR